MAFILAAVLGLQDDLPAGAVARLGQKGGRAVTAVDLSPDGKRAAIGLRDGRVEIWEVPAAKLARSTHLHRRSVSWVEFSPDGKKLATQGMDRAARIWDAASGEKFLDLKPEGSLYSSSISFSPDGATVAWGGRQKIHVADAATGKVLLSIDEKGHHLTSVDFSPDGKMVASGNGYAGVYLFAAFSGKERPLPKEAGGSHVRFSPAGRVLASWGMGKGVKLSDFHLGKHLGTIAKDQEPTALAFSADGKRIALALGDRSIRILDAGTGKELRKLDGHTLKITSLAFGKTHLLSGSEDGTALLWEGGK